jgi:hypothetical protein
MIVYWVRPKRRFTRVRRLLAKIGDFIATYTESAYLDDDFNRWDIYPNPYVPTSYRKHKDAAQPRELTRDRS